ENGSFFNMKETPEHRRSPWELDEALYADGAQGKRTPDMTISISLFLIGFLASEQRRRNGAEEICESWNLKQKSVRSVNLDWKGCLRMVFGGGSGTLPQMANPWGATCAAYNCMGMGVWVPAKSFSVVQTPNGCVAPIGFVFHRQCPCNFLICPPDRF